MPQPPQQTSSQKLHKMPPGVSVEFGRPDMAALIDAALAEVEAAPIGTPSTTCVNRGLFVCVCGPGTLVQSCKVAVRDAKRRHQGVAVSLHAEEPDW